MAASYSNKSSPYLPFGKYGERQMDFLFVLEDTSIFYFTTNWF